MSPNLNISRIRGSATSVDLAGFRVKMHRAMVRLWKGATWAFVDAITSPPFSYIHVDTGMSMASVIPLAEQLRKGRIIRGRIMSMNPSKAKIGYTTLHGGTNPRALRSRTHGERLGEDAYKLVFGDPATGGGWFFEFRIVVSQYYFNESLSNSGNSKGWETIKNGQAAFKSYMNENSPLIMKQSLSWLLRRTTARDVPGRFNRG